MFKKLDLNSAPREVETLDTTLREGSQARGVNFTIQAKLKIALELDDLGVHIIEAGWPGASPKDLEFFKLLKEYSFSNSRIAAFTSTRRKDLRPDEDLNLNSILSCDVDTAVIVGKSWDLHVREIIRTTLEDNLEMISESIEFLKAHGLTVIFDAEHFFDGFKENKIYAIRVLKLAEESGADVLVLADTNGGFLPHEVFNIVKEVVNHVRTPVGVHMHNDSGNSVANTILGVLAGARHIHGTINGLGERTGNADLCQVLPNLEVKLGIKALKGNKPLNQRLKKLTHLSNMIYELSGAPKNPYQPYVGLYAFAHKAGLHIDAVLKVRRAYEHVDPELIGNKRLFTVSDLSGRASIIARISEELKISLDKSRKEIIELLNEIKSKIRRRGLC